MADYWRDEDRWRRSESDRRYMGGERDWDRDTDYGRSGREDRRGYSRRDDYGRSGRDYGQDYDYGRGYRGGSYASRGGSYGSYGGSDYGRSGYGGYGDYGSRHDYDYGSSGGYEGQGRMGWAGDYYRGDVGRRYRGFGWGPDYGRDYGHRGHGGEERGFFERAGDEVRSWFGDEDAERRRHMDEVRAEHRGRGPRGYVRSDERIREDVNDRLTDDLYLDASDIEVSVNNGEVTLSGTVDSRTAKRRAEDIADDVSGAKHVQNNLRVREAASTWGPTQTAGGSTGMSTGMSTGTSTGTTAGRTRGGSGSAGTV